MTFKEATEEIQDNLDLIGKKIKGGTIDEIIAFPVDEKSKEIFKERYIRTQDAEYSIEPFLNEEVAVCAVINKNMIRGKIFITVNLDEIKNELNK